MLNYDTIVCYSNTHYSGGVVIYANRDVKYSIKTIEYIGGTLRGSKILYRHNNQLVLLGKLGSEFLFTISKPGERHSRQKENWKKSFGGRSGEYGGLENVVM